MCLYHVDDKPKKVKVGYKIYHALSPAGNYLAPFYYTQHKMGETYKDKKTARIQSGSYTDTYDTGFHFFLKKRDAIGIARYRRGIVVKVKVSDITATGNQDCTLINSKGAVREGYVPAGAARTITLEKVEVNFKDEKYNSFYKSNYTHAQY